ncbi:EscU/YscU/HrcU family type III secretion system export apparatus switch protein [Acidibrevibacterium fodinaquatile]|uniref:EscU/YscU/HrcU family type III secretion system export apparatus switch protein n=1 Tax=Acidibrevibacterium fodinaquatile TaxID=1969806 RepID=UPI000E0DBE8D|nr:EscU/YscU/HrcU family type III secretion system export apparatus switch protein [Acidibrevibacterium fodinaquatile]
MAEETASPEDRTEAATPHRLQQAREQGQVALSHEAPALVALAMLALVLWLLAPMLAHGLVRRLAFFLGAVGQLDAAGRPGFVIGAAIGAGAFAALPIIALTAGVGALVTLLQTGFVLKPTALLPDLTRLSPMAGFGRLFSLATLQRAGKDLVKLAAIGFALWHVLRSAVPLLGNAPYWDAATLTAHLLDEVWRVLMTLLLVQTAVTGADILFERTRHLRNLRMSRDEIRRETKDSEGDPHVKNRLRLLRRQRAKKRMLAAVRQATVVVTNPTHFAVALRYDRGMNTAPTVVAKGMDEMAARIRAVAKEHKVPVVANPPLARALHEVPLDAEIPAEHYKAVAELIAYVWRLQGRLQRRGAAGGRF